MPTLYRRQQRDGSQAQTFTANFTYRGVRVNRDTGCSTKQEAKGWIVRAKREVDEKLRAEEAARGHSVELRLDEALAKYVTEKLQYSASWDNADRYAIKRLADRLDATKVKLADLSTQHVAQYVASRTREVSGSSIARDLAVLKAMHTWATDVWEHDCRNIAWRSVWPKIRETARHKPTAAEVRALLEAASPRLANTIKAAVLGGLRKHELAELRWPNISLERKEMRFKGKGQKEVILPLSSALISLLSSLPQDTSKPVFDTRNFRREWDLARKQTGLEHIVFHGLRHATATWLDELGVPPQTIQRVMRHSDIDTTLRYMATEDRRVSGALEQIAEQMDQITERTGSSESQHPKDSNE